LLFGRYFFCPLPEPLKGRLQLLAFGYGGSAAAVQRDGHDEVLARSINLVLGRAAYETAKGLYPKEGRTGDRAERRERGLGDTTECFAVL
jgi:hypothetical protein